MKNALFKLLAFSLFMLPIADRAHAEEPETITVAITAAFVSDKGVEVYDDIVRYLSRKTGMNLVLLNGLSYSNVNAMLENGDVQMAFVCGYPYVLSHDGKENPPIRLMAAPVMQSALYKDKPKYYSYVIVHKDSPVAKFEELKGKTWVYNDPISNSGYNMPRAKLVSIGQDWNFFGKVLQSGAHEESIRMVAEGKADASAVDSLVLDYALAEHEEYADQVKVIETLGPAGAPPVVTSAKLAPEKVEKIKAALIGMQDDPEGRKILEDAYLARFADVDNDNYNDVRGMAESAKKASFKDLD